MVERKNKPDSYYLEKIRIDMEFICIHMQEKSYSQFIKDEVLCDSMMFRLIQISENTKRLSEVYRKSHPEIPWNEISGLRNRIVHDYGHVVLNVVYEALTEDIPNLLGSLI